MIDRRERREETERERYKESIQSERGREGKMREGEGYNLSIHKILQIAQPS